MDRNSRVKRSSSSELPNLYDIFLCEVANVQQYGIFVKIPGYRKNGLVHKSQMSKTRVDDPSDMVELHDRVYCKVISIDQDGEKIGMSMKVVNQTTGQDLDPGHVQTALDEQRRKTGHVKEIPRIELGAVLDTTCRKCGGQGHLAQDCFHVSGSKSYSLLPDLKYLAQEEEKSRKHKQKKKKEKLSKKEKKAKKKAKKMKDQKYKHRKSESSDEERVRHHKKKKRRKKETESSSSSSDTSEDEPAQKRYRRVSDGDKTDDHDDGRWRRSDRESGKNGSHYRDKGYGEDGNDTRHSRHAEQRSSDHNKKDGGYDDKYRSDRHHMGRAR